MHRRLLAAVSTLVFSLLMILSFVITDLHDRTYPADLGAHVIVGLGVDSLEMKDAEALDLLARESARSKLGLVKILPGANGIGRHFIALDDTRSRRPVVTFGAAEPSSLEGRDGASQSVASGEYLVTGDSADLPAFRSWLTEHPAFTVRLFEEDSLSSIFQAVASQTGFAIPLVASSALLATLVLYWLTVRSRGRALRALAGSAPGRIHAEDVAGLVLPATLSAAVSISVFAGFVAATQGRIFVSEALRIALTLGLIQLFVLALSALLLSILSLPTARILGNRESGVKAVRLAAILLQVGITALALFSIAPTVSAYGDASAISRQQDQWKIFGDKAHVAIIANGTPAAFKRIQGPLARMVSEAMSSQNAALSYTLVRGEVTSLLTGDDDFDSVALVNPAWLDLVGVRVAANSVVEDANLRNSDLVRARFARISAPWVKPDLRVSWLDRCRFIRTSQDTSTPAAIGGSGELAFERKTLYIVVDRPQDVFTDDFLASTLGSGNIIFSGPDQTAALLQKYEVAYTTNVVRAAEEELLKVQYFAYFAYLRLASLVALLVSLLVIAGVVSLTEAILKAHRDFPRILDGRSWLAIAVERVPRDWAVVAMLTVAALVWSARAYWWSTVGLALSLAAITCCAHALAIRQCFRSVQTRRL